jgi:hypothetical protein
MTNNSHAAIDNQLKRLKFYRLDESASLPAKIELDRLQMTFGCTLPADYRYFLTTYGPGGFGSGGLIELPDGCPIGRHFSVDIIYGIGASDDWNPFSLLQSTYGELLPREFLPIASDPGGNLLLLQCGSQFIHAWDHEHRELDDKSINQMIEELQTGGVNVREYTLGQLILTWEKLHPNLVKNPTGHSNLYHVADSFIQLLERFKPHPDYQ